MRACRAATGIDVDRAGRRRADRRARAGGAVDFLVNNAGRSFARALDELTDDDWHGAWELHVMASMRLMRAFAPGMAERGWGRIVNVTSSAGKRPSLHQRRLLGHEGRAALALARVRRHLRRRGVLVNAVAPGPVSSPLWVADGGLGDQTAQPGPRRREEALDAQAARVPLGRFARAGRDRRRDRLPVLRARLGRHRRRLVGRRRHLLVDRLTAILSTGRAPRVLAGRRNVKAAGWSGVHRVISRSTFVNGGDNARWRV